MHKLCLMIFSFRPESYNIIILIITAAVNAMVCTNLMDLVNEDVAYNMDDRPVDTVATYTCNHGYTLNGGTTRTCRSDGIWNGSDPTCEGWWF